MEIVRLEDVCPYHFTFAQHRPGEAREDRFGTFCDCPPDAPDRFSPGSTRSIFEPIDRWVDDFRDRQAKLAGGSTAEQTLANQMENVALEAGIPEARSKIGE